MTTSASSPPSRELQAALDGWVVEYNTERPHQSCGGRPPAERFALAERSIVAVDVDEPPCRGLENRATSSRCRPG